jgi:glycosyltransferase involved in cell wall biosynthesis
MMDADLLTVSTRELAKRFDFFNRNIQVIPNGWSADNPYWKRFYPHDGVHIGWAGTITHREDFKLCLSALLEVTRRYPEAKIFIGGDVEIYQMLKQVPEKQKFFLPMMTYEDYPHMLGFFDILIAPLIDDEFNRAKSDIKLVDAGAKGIPWVASSIEFYREWKDGGYIAGYKDDWIQALSHLVRMPGHREDVGEWGHKKALTREMGTLVHTWIRAIEFALENKK